MKGLAIFWEILTFFFLEPARAIRKIYITDGSASQYLGNGEIEISRYYIDLYPRPKEVGVASVIIYLGCCAKGWSKRAALQRQSIFMMIYGDEKYKEEIEYLENLEEKL